MKRLFVILLAIALLTGLCACGPASVEEPTASETTQATETTAPEAGELLVGYARVDITPKVTAPLRGYGDTSDRMASTVLQPICGTCIAVTGDNGETVLLMSVDLCRAMPTVVDKVRPMICEATGVPEENIFINVSHTHAAPDISNSSESFFMSYLKELRELLTNAAISAMADRQPAQMTYGSIETENMTFNRHFEWTDVNGKVVRSGGTNDSVARGHDAKYVDAVDPTMHVIRFARETGKDVVMVNWRSHPLLDSSSVRTALSADYIGTFRTAVELIEGCNFAYFQGAAGITNSITAIYSDSRTDNTDVYGAILARYVSECLANNMHEADGYAVQTRQTILKAKLDLELNAITIGNSVAFTTAPGEIFDSNSAYMEENSPYPMSFTLGYTNGHHGYIPDAVTYTYDWYERQQTKFDAGTGEEIQETFLKMLREISDSNPVTDPANDKEAVILPAINEPDACLPLYWNVHRQEYTPGGTLDHSSRLPEEDGYYHVVFAADGKQQTLLVKNKNLIEIIDFNDITGLVLDANGVVTDVKVLRECSGGLAANRSVVMGVEGNAISCATAAEEGVPFTLTLTDQSKVYDVSSVDENCGKETTLRKGDQITAVQDHNGVVTYVYVLRRTGADSLEHADHCVCGGAAVGLHGECAAITEWIAWGDDPEEWDTLPIRSGRYYLTRDVVISKRPVVRAGEEVTICLNGKTVSSQESRLLATLGTLNICDCRFSCDDGEYTFEGALFVDYGRYNQYGGALYGYNHSEMNVYGGMITSTGTFQRGGLICIRGESTANIYNAVITCGSVLEEGGNIQVMENSNLNIYGGVITNGNSSSVGGGIYLSKGTLTISGAPKITGNQRSDLYLGKDQKITIGEGGLQPGAEIGIMIDAGIGVFATNASKEDAKYFATVKGKVVWDAETQTLSVIE